MPLLFNTNTSHYISAAKDFSKVGTPVTPSTESSDEFPSLESMFDVIIIGGGTTGCVLASRLSEGPSVRVLLLEAGRSGYHLFTRVPGAYNQLWHNEKHVFQFYTEPQENVKGRKLFWPRAKMLGGCSSINAEMAQYGSPADFDEWAAITGDESWAWKNFNSDFRKFEHYMPQPNQPKVDMSSKGTEGPVKVGYFTRISPSTSAFLEACKNLRIPFSTDFNQASGAKGVNRLMSFVDEKHERVSSESAYLTKQVLKRPNLKVAVQARVTKILFEEQDKEIRAVGVEFTSDQDGPRYRAYSRREVIVSAGTVHSPQLLLLSGIGPKDQLQEHDIPVVHDLPGVGLNLIDPPSAQFYFKDKTGRNPAHMIPHSWLDLIRLGFSGLQYLLRRRGPLAGNWGEGAAFLRSDDETLFPPEEFPEEIKLEDSTSSSESPDLEIFTIPIAYREHTQIGWNTPTFAYHVCLLRPLSRGSITLNSSDPWDHPVIDPNYLESKHDVAKLVRCARLVLKIARTEPVASRVGWKYIGKEAEILDMVTTDEEIEDIVRERLETSYHPTSTCRMTPLERGGVVDSKLRVYGIKGLRVCDASVFPNMVSGHAAGACFAIGERLAHILKSELGAR